MAYDPYGIAEVERPKKNTYDPYGIMTEGEPAPPAIWDAARESESLPRGPNGGNGGGRAMTVSPESIEPEVNPPTINYGTPPEIPEEWRREDLEMAKRGEPAGPLEKASRQLTVGPRDMMGRVGPALASTSEQMAEADRTSRAGEPFQAQAIGGGIVPRRMGPRIPSTLAQEQEAARAIRAGEPFEPATAQEGEQQGPPSALQEEQDKLLKIGEEALGFNQYLSGIQAGAAELEDETRVKKAKEALDVAQKALNIHNRLSAIRDTSRKLEERSREIAQSLAPSHAPTIQEPSLAVSHPLTGQERMELSEPEPSVAASAGKGLAKGTLDIARSIGTGIRYMGTRTGVKDLQEAGKVIEEHWGKEGEKYEPHSSIQGAIAENPKLLKKGSWWAYNVANIVPSFAASIIPGVGATRTVMIGGKALRFAPQLIEKLAILGGALTGGTVGGGLEGAGTYQEIISKGGTEDEAAIGMELMTLASAGLNAISVGKALTPGKTALLKHILKSAGVESITEYLEEPAEISIKTILGKMTDEEAKQQLIEGLNVIPPTFVTGGMGGVTGKAVQKTTEKGGRPEILVKYKDQAEPEIKTQFETPIPLATLNRTPSVAGYVLNRPDIHDEATVKRAAEMVMEHPRMWSGKLIKKADAVLKKVEEPVVPIEQLEKEEPIIPIEELEVKEKVPEKKEEKAEGGLNAFEEALAESDRLKAKHQKIVEKFKPKEEEKALQVHEHSSTQINLPDKDAKAIKDFGLKIPESEIYTDPSDPSFGREEQPHITVRYGMDTVDPKEIAPAFEGMGPIKAKMGKVSIFEDDKYDVVKVDIESPGLHEANKKIGETVKLPGETFKDYKPHATIAYVKKGEGKKYVGDKSFEGKEITVDTITLTAKDGKNYDFELKGKSVAIPPESGIMAPVEEKIGVGEISTEKTPKTPEGGKLTPGSKEWKEFFESARQSAEKWFDKKYPNLPKMILDPSVGDEYQIARISAISHLTDAATRDLRLEHLKNNLVTQGFPRDLAPDVLALTERVPGQNFETFRLGGNFYDISETGAINPAPLVTSFNIFSAMDSKVVQSIPKHIRQELLSNTPPKEKRTRLGSGWEAVKIDDGWVLLGNGNPSWIVDDIEKLNQFKKTKEPVWWWEKDVDGWRRRVPGGSNLKEKSVKSPVPFPELGEPETADVLNFVMHWTQSKEAGKGTPAVTTPEPEGRTVESPTVTPKGEGGEGKAIVLPRKEYIPNNSPEYLEYSRKRKQIWDEYRHKTEHFTDESRKRAYALSREEGIRWDREIDRYVQEREQAIRNLGKEIPQFIEETHYDSFPMRGIKSFNLDNSDSRQDLLKTISSLDGYIGIRGIYKREIGKKTLKPSFDGREEVEGLNKRLGGTSVIDAGETSDYRTVNDLDVLLTKDASKYGDSGIVAIVFTKETPISEVIGDFGESVFPNAKVIGYLSVPIRESLPNPSPPAVEAGVVPKASPPKEGATEITEPGQKPGFLLEEKKAGSGKIYHFTKAENIPRILREGFDTGLPPIHGTGALQKKETYTPGDKSGKNVLYFTTDKERWNKATVYVGEGKGEKDYSYYDYDKQKWITEKKAQSTIDLSPVEATIKENSKILTIDSYKSYMDFQKKHFGDAFIKDRMADVVNKAKDLGYDVLNVKHIAGQWEDPKGNDRFVDATGAGGKNDFFILNKDTIDLIKPEKEAEHAIGTGKIKEGTELEHPGNVVEVQGKREDRELQPAEHEEGPAGGERGGVQQGGALPKEEIAPAKAENLGLVEYKDQRRYFKSSTPITKGKNKGKVKVVLTNDNIVVVDPSKIIREPVKPAEAPTPAPLPSFREFVISKGERWPMGTGNPRWTELKAEHDRLKAGEEVPPEEIKAAGTTRKIPKKAEVPPPEIKGEAPPAEEKPLLSQETARKLLSLPYERRAYPSGEHNAQFRQQIIKELTGEDVPKSKAGAGRVREELARAAGVDIKGKAPIEIEEGIHAWLKGIAEGKKEQKEAEPEAAEGKEGPTPPAEAETYPQDLIGQALVDWIEEIKRPNYPASSLRGLILYPDLTGDETRYLNAWDKKTFSETVLSHVKDQGLMKEREVKVEHPKEYPDLTVTGQMKEVPDRPGVTYVVHRVKPVLGDTRTFRVIVSSEKPGKGGFLTVDGKGGTVEEAYDNALLEFDRKIAERPEEKAPPLPPKGFASEVLVEKKWNRNGLVFATEKEAEDYGTDLMGRWMMAEKTRVVPIDEAPNNTFKNWELNEIEAPVETKEVFPETKPPTGETKKGIKGAVIWTARDKQGNEWTLLEDKTEMAGPIYRTYKNSNYITAGNDKEQELAQIKKRAEIIGIVEGKPAPAKEFGAENKVFTRDAADAARERIRQKLKGIHMGAPIDPQLLQDGITIAGYYVEGGTRKFNDFVKQMVSDFGDTIRPYLKSWYNAIRDYPGFDATGMDSYDEVARTETVLPAKEERPGAKEFLGELTEKYEAARKSVEIANFVQGKLESGTPFTKDELFAAATETYGGTMAEGKFNAKDAFDAMEMGINKYIADTEAETLTAFSPYGASAETAKNNIELIRQRIMDKIPSQAGIRSTEQDEFQQFSTPPDLAYTMAWAANIGEKDTVLEPSAGIGGLAVFANMNARETIVNELSPRRAGILTQMDFSRVFTENSEQLHNILPKDVRPTVILMNPPFSATAGRMPGQRASANVVAHLDQALKRLEPDGRLVALIGKGWFADPKAVKAFLKNLVDNYNLRANITVEGKGYAKYGTTYDNRILVVDKSAPEGKPTVTATVEDVKDAIPLLREVRDARLTPKPRPIEQEVQGVSQAGEAGTRPEPAILSPTGGLGGVLGGGPGEGRPIPEHPGISAGGETKSGVPISEAGGGRGGILAPAGQGTTGEPGGPGRVPGGRPGLEGQPAPEGGISPAETAAVELERTREEERPTEITDSLYESYKPKKAIVKNSKPHPGPIVESAAMASVDPPEATYTPHLAKEIIESGKLSEVQLEPIIYAGQSHQEIMANGDRMGHFIGDGTGVGKGREIVGVIWDNWNQGRKKAVWLSQNSPLIEDAKRDLRLTGWDEKLVFDVGRIKLGTKIKNEIGIAFVGYDLLRSKKTMPSAAPGQSPGAVEEPITKTRLDQLVEWFGKDYDGVIVFDESHNMGNAIPVRGRRGTTKPSAKALAGLELQNALPNARIVYASATAATEVMNFAYARRLGLWGEGTSFADAPDFITKISSGGVGAMEIVARDLKAMGRYTARSLSYDGVKYNRIEHVLTQAQREIYDELAGAWQIVLQNIHAALQVTGITGVGHAGNVRTLNGAAKSAAMSAFWGSHQRFFNQIITAMQMPTVIKAIERDIEAGKAVVLQLVNTNEAATKRALSRMEEEDELEDLDITPREQLMEFIKNSFPVYQYETYLDNEGNEKSRLVVDSEGNAVENAEAVAMREELLNRLGAIKVPDNPMDSIINHFGNKKVAEVSGRTKRVIEVEDEKGKHRIVEKRSKSKAMADADAFMADKKQVLMFTYAGGTGRSYHADLDPKVKNKRQRIHYLVQPGWRADRAIQGLGRSHRSNQAHKPEYNLVTTDLPGHKRFMSSVARRLDQLGALTKGQRQTGGQGLFKERDNLESRYASNALDKLVQDIADRQVPEMGLKEFSDQLGLKLIDDQGNLNVTAMPEIPQFLNRLLSMKIDMQNKVFDLFSERLDAEIARAIQDGTLDVGLETMRAKKIEKVNEQPIHTDPKSGAQTKFVELELTRDAQLIPWEKSDRFGKGGYVRNIKSGRIWALSEPQLKTNARTGDVTTTFTATGVSYGIHRLEEELVNDTEKYERLGKKEAKALWDTEYVEHPKEVKERQYLVTGALLPIYNRLPEENARIVRIQTSAGERMIGRLIPPKQLEETKKRLGAETTAIKWSPKEAFDNILVHGYSLRLANNWTIVRRKVAGEDRIEVKQLGWREAMAFKGHGLIEDRIQYETRHFIPTDDRGVDLLRRMLDNNPIMQAIPRKSTAEIIARGETSLSVAPGEKEEEHVATSKREDWNDLFRRKLEAGRSEVQGILESNFGERFKPEDVRVPKELTGEHLRIVSLGREFAQDILFFDGIKSAAEAEGFVDPDHLGRIYLNTNAKNPDLVFRHELMHSEALTYPDEFDTLRDEIRGSFQNLETFKEFLNKSYEKVGAEQLDDDIIEKELISYLAIGEKYEYVKNPKRVKEAIDRFFKETVGYPLPSPYQKPKKSGLPLFRAERSPGVRFSDPKIKEFADKVASILAPGSKVEFVTKINLKTPGTIEGLKSWNVSPEEVEKGVYTIRGRHRTIYLTPTKIQSWIDIALDAGNIRQVVAHEGGHGVFQLLDALGRRDDLLFIRRHYGTLEKAADAFSDHYLKREGMEGSLAVTKRARSIFDTIVDFFRKIRNWLQGKGYRSVEDIFGKAMAGEYRRQYAAREGKIDRLRGQVERLGIPPATEGQGKLFGIRETKIPEVRRAREAISGLPVRTNLAVSRVQRPTFEFSDPEIERNFQKSVPSKPPVKERARDMFSDILNKMTRPYEHIPRTGEFAQLAFDLDKLKKQKGVSSYRAILAINKVTAALDAENYDLFARKVILDDLSYEAERGHDLPWGFTKDSVATELERLDEAISDNEAIQDALMKRKAMWSIVKKEYTDAMKSISFDVADRFKNENYFRHQVLEYVNLKGLYGTGKKLKTPVGRGFLKTRHGSSFDINRDYVEPEYEVLAQMIYDIQVAKTIKHIDDKYNIQRSLKQRAKGMNEAAVRDLVFLPMARDLWKPGMVHKGEGGEEIEMTVEDLAESLYRSTLNVKQAMGFKRLQKLAEDGALPDLPNNQWSDVIDSIASGGEHEGTLPYLAWVAKHYTTTDAGKAATLVFKGIAGKKKYIEDALKAADQFVTWETLVPEGYVTWQAREGNVFYMADSIPAKLAEQLMTAGLEQIGVSKNDLKKALTMGGKRREFVIKKEIADTLDELTRTKVQSAFVNADRELLRAWKVWQLIAPRRFFKYNLRNLTGDADAVFVGNPRAFLKVPAAVRELGRIFFDKYEIKGELKEFFERGGFSSNLQAQEMGELKELWVFERLYKEQHPGVKDVPAKAWNAYWKSARIATEVRETILRYAAYLDYLEQMQSDPRGRPKNFGASKPDEIMGLEDIRDRAYWLSNDLLGAYDRISVMGNALRDYWIPFWSWKELNFRRYVQFARNAASDGRLCQAVGRTALGGVIKSPYLAFRVGSFLISSVAFWSMLALWNHLLFPDEEDELSIEERSRPHIIFGRDSAGRIISFNRIGALGDFLDWFGLGKAPRYIGQLFKGQRTIKEIATEMAKSPVNVLSQGITPYIKIPAELAGGRSFFPDIFRPTAIRDRGLYLFRSMGLENEYIALAGLPSKGYSESLKNFLFYTTDPGQGAYSEVQEEKRRWLKTVGKEAEGFWLTPKANALYNLRLAIRYKDKEAVKKYVREYIIEHIRSGGKLENLAKGIREAQKYMDPLSGLSKEDKIRFLKSLDKEQLERLNQAAKFYRETIMGQK